MSAEARFWEEKILRWERWRYSRLAALNPFSWTVRARLRHARELLQPLLEPGARVVELGCGGGHLIRGLKPSAPIRYFGVDISRNAIDKARISVLAGGVEADFFVGDVRDVLRVESDVVVFLGLVDWLEPGDLGEVLKRTRAKAVLFSFTEKKRGISRLPYRVYRTVLGIRARGYRAKSYSTEEVAAIVEAAGFEITNVHARFAMGPGRLMLLRPHE